MFNKKLKREIQGLKIQNQKLIADMDIYRYFFELEKKKKNVVIFDKSQIQLYTSTKPTIIFGIDSIFNNIEIQGNKKLKPVLVKDNNFVGGVVIGQIK